MEGMSEVTWYLIGFVDGVLVLWVVQAWKTRKTRRTL